MLYVPHSSTSVVLPNVSPPSGLLRYAEKRKRKRKPRCLLPAVFSWQAQEHLSHLGVVGSPHSRHGVPPWRSVEAVCPAAGVVARRDVVKHLLVGVERGV